MEWVSWSILLIWISLGDYFVTMSNYKKENKTFLCIESGRVGEWSVELEERKQEREILEASLPLPTLSWNDVAPRGVSCPPYIHLHAPNTKTWLQRQARRINGSKFYML